MRPSIYGGLGGGAIDGTINVTALNLITGSPVLDAFVIVGEDLATEYQGLTDLHGAITFSGPDLVGPVTVHVAKDCFERTSFVAFDAQQATAFLYPLELPRCGAPGAGPPPRGRQGSYVRGELVWSGPLEYGPNPWLNIPEPRPGEVKVAYVATTQACAGDAEECQNPDPSTGGGMARILEELPEAPGPGAIPGGRLYLPRLSLPHLRPAAGLAVYAIARLENPTSGVHSVRHGHRA